MTRRRSHRRGRGGGLRAAPPHPGPKPPASTASADAPPPTAVRAWVVVGVVPGARATGITARSGSTYLDHQLVVRESPGPFADPPYLWEVCEAVQAWTQAWPTVTLAIQGVADARRRSRIDDREDGGDGLIALGQVLGALKLCFADALWLPPDGHGRNLLASYPAPLVDPDELARLTGDGQLKKCRGGWDLAARAIGLVRRETRALAQRQAAAPPLARPEQSEVG